MFIAKERRRENIAEYILYLWQLEDLFRALSFDEERIKNTLISSLEVDEKKKQEAFWWYMGIVSLLKEEGRLEAGHSSHSLHLISNLNDIHLYLLDKKKDEHYRQLYYTAQPDIMLFKEKMGSERFSDIETCFHALYSQLLLKLKKEELSAETQQAFSFIARLVAYLSAKFHRFEQGKEVMDKLE